MGVVAAMPVSAVSPRVLRRPLLVLVGLAVALHVVPPLAAVAYLVAAVYALRGPRETVEAYAVLFLLLLGNFGSGAEALRWLVLFAGFGRVVWDTVLNYVNCAVPRRIVATLIVFFSCILVASLTVSKMPLISALKLISLTVGTLTIFISLYRTRHLRTYWRDTFYTLAIFVFGGSVIAFFLGIGYLRTVEGFQGVFKHPQMLGPVAAILTAHLAGEVLHVQRVTKLHAASILLGCLFIFASGARTAAVAFGGGLIVALSLWVLVRGEQLRAGRFIFNPTALVVACGLAALFAWKGDTLQQRATDFVMKQRGNEELLEGGLSPGDIFEQSRGDRMRQSMNNFRASPLLGIGLGVPTDWEAYRHVKIGTLGLPVGASVEKGFMPSAVLEETGLVGAVLVVVLVLCIFLPVLKNASFGAVWMFWTSLLINVGAAVFFSIGGVGLFMWLALGFSYSQALSSSYPR